MRMGTNTGSKALDDLMKELRGFKARVQENKNGAENELSFVESVNQCHVKCGNTKEDAF